MAQGEYTKDDFQTLEWHEHIRQRPGMYIGKLGDGSMDDDGIYVLIKEVVDNSVDEYVMGAGKVIEIDIEDKEVRIRDYGRGIPLEVLADAVGKMNTGAKYGSEGYAKSVGLNGVGTKAVNALSSKFVAFAVREGTKRTVEFSEGKLVGDKTEENTGERNGTGIIFKADETIFGQYSYRMDIVENMVKNYSYLNTGLTLKLNGTAYKSSNGLIDLLNQNYGEQYLYEPIHLKGQDIEVVLSHGNGYNETYYSFVNGQHTTQGGTHQAAFKEAVARVLKEFYKKDFDPADVRMSIVAAISVRVIDPVFESQTKTKLGSRDIDDKGTSIKTFVGDFLKEQLDNYLHKNPFVAESILKKIQDNEKERKAMSGVQKKAREMAKKVSLNNKKLRDCRIHLNDRNPLAEESSIFITEGDSASGSITKSRNANTQAVFSLRGKPLNTFGMQKKDVYLNEEFNLLQAALNIEEDMDNLRYNKIIIATDADVDGMHIRLLMLTYFLQFFPDLIRQDHVYILQTPLFRVRDKKQQFYCYSEEERDKAVKKFSSQPEITRFKGLGEISPDEFKGFIGETIRLEKVQISSKDAVRDMLEFYMGKNTDTRRDFIIDNLREDVDNNNI